MSTESTESPVTSPSRPRDVYSPKAMYDATSRSFERFWRSSVALSMTLRHWI